MESGGSAGNVIIAARQSEKEREFWLNKLAGEWVKSRFPVDRLEAGAKSPRLDRLEFDISGELFSRLSWITNESDARLHMILVALLNVLLLLYTGNEDIIVGTPIYKQNMEGDFINTVLLLRNQLQTDMTFKELLLRVRETIQEAVENQNYPFQAILYDLNLPPGDEDNRLFDVVIMLQNIHEKRYIDHVRPNFLFSFQRSGDGVEGVVEYNTLLYRRTTVERIIRYFLHLAGQVLFEVDMKLRDVDMVPEEEKRRIMCEFSGETLEGVKEKTVDEWFEEQAEASPGRVAVVYKDKQVTCRALRKRCRRLAGFLRSVGVGHAVIVGILTDRSIEMITAIMAVLKAGGAYLPILPAYPGERIKLMLADCRAAVLLTQEQRLKTGQSAWPGLAAERIFPLDDEGIYEDKRHDWRGIGQPGSTAYVIYTSGSSGVPKGVMVEHRSVTNLVWGLGERIYKHYGHGLRVSLVTPYIFDASVKQIFTALLLGHGLYIVPEDVAADGAALLKFYEGYRIDIADGTPSHLRLLLASLKRDQLGSTIKHFVIGGEVFPPRLATEMWERFAAAGVRITNVYGPTECCDVSTSYDIRPGDLEVHDSIPIGRPIPNICVYIVNGDGKWLPTGVVGELWVGGMGVARGYLNNPELTAEKFICQQISTPKSYILNPKSRTLYRTGDLARWLPDGNIEFVGRKDQQVKIRGFRIEPAEIESQLLGVETISRAVVIDKEDGEGDKYLCAYFVSAPKGPRGTPEIHKPDAFEKIEKKVRDFDLRDLKIDDGLWVSGHLYDFAAKDGDGSLLKHFEKAVERHGHEVGVKRENRALSFSVLDRYADRLAGVIGQNYDDRYRLDRQERRRYSRQLLLDGWGIESQERLKETTVFVAGAGGIGSQIIKQLALLGLGTIIICDPDEVELSNLNRQGLHDISRIGMNKAVSAKMTVERTNAHVKVIVHPRRVTRENIDELVGEAAVIFDCVDDLETKFVLSECAVSRQIPHVLSAMIETNSYAAILHAPHTPCFHCLHDRSKVDEINEMRRLVGDYHKKPFPVAVPALYVTAGFVCNEILKVILGLENPAYNKFFLFNQKGASRIVETDGYRQMTYSFNDHFKRISKEQGFDWDECWRGRFLEELTIRKDPDCPLCSQQRAAPMEKRRPSPPPYPANVNGQTVVSLVGDSLNMVAAVMGVLKSGRIYVPLDAAWPEEKLVALLDEIGSRLVLTDNRNLKLAVGIRDQVNKRIPVVNIDEVVEDGGMATEEFNVHADLEQTACILYRLNRKGEAVPLTSAGLQAYLADRLPEHMIPGYFVEIEKIPLTVNGKIDRRALPEPAVAGLAEGDEVPEDPVEKKLVKIWSEVLAIEQEVIGRNANFFELGGHSLRATTMVARINRELDIDLPLAEVFRAPTIRGLAEYIRKAAKDKFMTIGPAEKKDYYILSSVQSRLYFLQQIDLKGVSYNIPLPMMLEQEINRHKLEGTFKQLIKRHENLRTSFDSIDGRPVQRVHGEVDFAVEYTDLTGAPGGSPLESAKEMVNRFVRAFDLSKAPLFRVGLIKVARSKFILVIDIHHIISDGVSQGIMFQDVMALYGGETLPPLRLQYKDFSEWQHTPIYRQRVQRQEALWLEQFDDGVPLLNLPTDFPRPAVQGFEGEAPGFKIGVEETAALIKMAADEEMTLYMVLLAIFNVFLSKICNQTDIVIGTPIAGRVHADLEPIMGMLVNTLLLRNFPHGGKTFVGFLREVRERTLAAFDNQDYLFEDLVEKLMTERDASRNPLFDVMLVLQNMGINSGDETDLTEGGVEYENKTSKFDMTFIGVEGGGRLVFNVEYSTRLFKRHSIRMFITYFKRIVSLVIEDPAIRLGDIEVVDESGKERILKVSRGREERLGTDETIHGLFERKAAEKGSAAAVVFKGEVLTYRELNERANRLAHRLGHRGIGQNRVVGVMVERSAEMVMGILAVLKAGGVILPIDPEYPDKRKKYMLAESGASILLVNCDEEVVPGAVAVEAGVLDIRDPQLLREAGTNPAPINVGRDLLYIIYTSGSTGKPKGVMLEHRNLVNLLKYQFTDTAIDFSVVLQFATICFDVSYQEIFSTLLWGGKLVLIDAGSRRDIRALFQVVAGNRVRTLFLPTSFLKFIGSEQAYIDLIPGCVAHIVTAGEQLVVTGRLKRYLLSHGIYLHNHYGPSESHVVTAFTMEAGDEIADLPPIGFPVVNTGIYILDAQGRLQAECLAGELYIGGSQVGRGYLNNPELTGERFLSSIDFDRRIYRSGDLARRSVGGCIEFLGRIDHQVKIRGYRVELGEIESEIMALGSVKETVVMDREDENGQRYLCAYIVGEDGGAAGEIRNLLSKRLPAYMVPSYFIRVDSIPLTANGKVNRRALPEPEFSAASGVVGPRDNIDESLLKIWAEILGLEEKSIGIDGDFFELGGHSLRVTTLVLRINREMGLDLPIAEVFRSPTIRGLAEYLKRTGEYRYISIQSVEKMEYYSLSSAQRRLYLMQQMALESTGYNLPMAVVLEGKLERDRLAKGMGELISRHESLRTSFRMIGGQAVQVVHEEVNFHLDYFVSGEKEARGKIESLIRPFALDRPPLLRVGLVRVEEERHVLLIDMHHIISDGASIDILVRELMAIYVGEKLPELRLQYKDYSNWQHGEDHGEALKRQEEFWLEQFNDEVLQLNLPTDYERPAVQSFEGATAGFELGVEETAGLRRLALQEDATMFMVLLAIYNVLLSKLSHQQDIVVGTSILGRRHADLQHIIGMFVNTLALRNYPLREQSFRVFLRDVRDRTLAAFENQDYLFETLVQRVGSGSDVSRNPLFDAAIASWDIGADTGEIPEVEIPDLKLVPFEYQNRASKFDLTLYVSGEGEKAAFMFEYCTKLFSRETIGRFIKYFREVVSEVLKDESIRLKDIRITHHLVATESKILKEDAGEFGF